MPSEGSAEEARKRIYVFVGLVLIIPLLVGFGVDYWLSRGEGRFPAIANLATAGALAVIVLSLRRVTNTKLVYRGGMALLAALLLLNVAFGWHEGAGILWIYAFPLAAFYVFGTREGLIWVAAVVAPTIALVLAPSLVQAYDYPSAYELPLVTSILLLSAIAYLLESLRAHFVARLEAQKNELAAALENIQVLRGLLPICSYCKRIKDDQGYWHAVDSYIRAHTDVRFTHGMCDDCLEERFPDVYEEMLAEGMIHAVRAEDARRLQATRAAAAPAATGPAAQGPTEIGSVPPKRD